MVGTQAGLSPLGLCAAGTGWGVTGLDLPPFFGACGVGHHLLSIYGLCWIYNRYMLLTSKSLKTTIILREKSGNPIKTTSFDQKTDKNLSINAKKGPPQRVFRCSGPFGCAVILWGKKVGGSGNGKGQALAPPATDPQKRAPGRQKLLSRGRLWGVLHQPGVQVGLPGLRRDQAAAGGPQDVRGLVQLGVQAQGL